MKKTQPSNSNIPSNSTTPAALRRGLYVIPTHNSIETLDIGTGRFVLCSYFMGQTTIAYPMAKQMLADAQSGAIGEIPDEKA